MDRVNGNGSGKTRHHEEPPGRRDEAREAKRLREENVRLKRAIRELIDHEDLYDAPDERAGA